MPATSRAAFTIVEALVATAILGCTAAATVAALYVRGVVNRRSEFNASAAGSARASVRVAAARACAAADTAGAALMARGVASWTISRDGDAWRVVLHASDGPAIRTVETRVPCRA